MFIYLQAEPFWKAVDVTEFPQYREYVAHPMDLSLLERNIKKRMYGSTEAFVADTKWILHNCIIFNTCKLVYLFLSILIIFWKFILDTSIKKIVTLFIPFTWYALKFYCRFNRPYLTVWRQNYFFFNFSTHCI